MGIRRLKHSDLGVGLTPNVVVFSTMKRSLSQTGFISGLCPS